MGLGDGLAVCVFGKRKLNKEKRVSGKRSWARQVIFEGFFESPWDGTVEAGAPRMGEKCRER